MTKQPFLRCFLLVPLLFIVLQTAVIVSYSVKPQLFYFRAWEYFFRWSNYTLAEDSTWNGEEISGLGRRYLFMYQEKRNTHASTDRDGFRSVQADMGPPRILVQGRSNVFGSGVSDHETLPWQIAEQSGVAAFNGAHGELFSTLSRPDLGQVELVVDVYHERHFANINVFREIYGLRHSELQPYQPVAQQDLSTSQALYRPILRPSYWIPDLVYRWWQRLMVDVKERILLGHRPFLLLSYVVDEAPIPEYLKLMERRRRAMERLGYEYLAVIIPSRQTVYAPDTVPTRTLEKTTRLVDTLEKNGFPVANLFPGFRTESGRDLFFAYDTHWNASGINLAAEVIVEAIGRRYPALLAAESPEQSGQ